MLNQFSDEYKKIMMAAEARAKKLGHHEIIPEDIFLQIIMIKEGNIFDLFSSFGLNEAIFLEIFSRPPFSDCMKDREGDYVGISTRTKELVVLSMKLAGGFQKNFVGVEDFLLALFQIKNETWFYQMLDFIGVSPKDFEGQVTEMNRLIAQMGSGSANAGMFAPIEELVKVLEQTFGPGTVSQTTAQPFAANPPQKGKKEESKTPALDVFGSDLTAEAREGKIDPVIGRDREISRLISILNRKTKNNPCLVGDPGVGKTAIVEGLALKISQGEVPSAMQNKRIISIDISSMVAGTKYRGEFEARIKQVIDEASKMENEVILFIDEIHTIIGAGSGEGTLDAANILKPAMARGKICLIGATTLTEYQKYIEKDSALDRRFQKIDAPEPTREVSTEIIRGIKSGFEEFHNLIIDESAVEESVALSTRYITDRFLPDKAIDLIDEACSAKSMSYQFDDSEILVIREKMQVLQKEIEDLLISTQYIKAIDKKKKMEEYQEEITKKRKKTAIPKSKRLHITASDIRRVIHEISGVPMENLEQISTEKLKNLTDRLGSHIIGQEKAIGSLVSALRRNSVGISSQNRPIGSFLFLGPTGVGKTELVKVLAEEFYSDPKALIKIDMSEFQDRSSASKLIGTTAGYVGYEEGGMLTDRVRRKPYSIILFDEIEKGNFEIYNLLLQIMEDGSLTDGKGRTINFKNTIIIMTSNIGSEEFNSKAEQIGFATSPREEAKIIEDYDEIADRVKKQLPEFFSPEFLNRIDKTIVFNPLDKEVIKKIILLQLTDLTRRLTESNHLTLTYDPSVIDHLLTETYTPEYGARPVRRYLQDTIEDQIAAAIVEGSVHSTVHISTQPVTIDPPLETESRVGDDEKAEPALELVFVWDEGVTISKKKPRKTPPKKGIEKTEVTL